MILKRKTLIFLFLGLLPILSQSQKVITLADLYKAVDTNNPLSKINGGIDSVYQLKKKNLKVNYLPKLDLNASSTWQSQVTGLNVNLPAPISLDLPKADKDQYKVTLDVSEVIWDGGATKAKSMLEDFNQSLEKNRVDIEVLNVKDRITNLYFNLLILKVTESQLNLMCSELDKRISEVESGVKSGYLTSSTIDGLQAEKLKLLQSLDAVPAQRKALLSSIKSLTGIELSDSVTFVTPNPDELTELSCKRPEFAGFSYQQKVLNASADLVSRKRYPVLAGFATAGYGKPGLNMLSNEWDNFFLVGAKLSWNIWDWNTVRKEKQQIKIQDNMVDYRKQAYVDSYQSQIESIRLEIDKLKNQLNKDQEIVKLLHQVTERSASALKNGTITSSAYITDFNSESRAKLELELRNIKLSQQKVLLYNVSGNELINK